MTANSTPAQNSAKSKAMDTFVAKFKQEASKEIVSEQQTNKAIADAMPRWLESLDEKALIQFFAGIETIGGTALARKIERHPLRPAAVGPLVEAARNEAEAQKQAQKAEAERTKEAREKELLAKLLAKHGPTAIDDAEGGAD